MDTNSVMSYVGAAWVLWAIALFAGIVFWALRPKNKERFEDDGMIPFRDEMNGEA